MGQYYANYNKKLKTTARMLRKNMTQQEKHLWYDFLKTYPVKFYRQRPIDGYITDFLSIEAKLIIELDGSQHYTEDGMQYDTMRSDILKRCGFRILRFTNPQIDKQFHAVCTAIDAAVQASPDKE